MLYDCNYRCSYCFFEGKWEEYRKRTRYLSPEELMAYWNRVCEKYGPVNLIISGGEPFIYPNFIEIIKRLSQICFHINISSNSSGDLASFVEEISPQKVSLSLSYHPQFDDLDNFIRRLLFIRKHNFNGCINLVAYPAFLEQIPRLHKRFAEINETLKIIPFFGQYRGKDYPQDYTPEEQAIIGIDESWFTRVKRHGTICQAGRKTALIFPDGKVARCGQMGEKFIIGNFFDQEFNLLDKNLPCEAQYCPCGEDETFPGEEQNAIKEETKEGEADVSRNPESSRPIRPGIYFTWDIHYKCNFRCPYCWFYKKWVEEGKRNVYLTPEEWMTHWQRIYDKYGKIRIEITGGEPFMYPNFIKLIKLLSAIHKVKITTNMSGDIQTFVKEISPDAVYMDLNFHPLFSQIDTHIEKTLLLKNAGFKAGVCYLAYPPQIKRINFFKKRFEEKGINFALAAFWGEYDNKKYPESYSEEEKEIIRPFLGDIDRNSYHLNAQSPKGKLCNAGYRYAVVQADGKVVRCGQLPDNPIGSIMDKDFRLFDAPLPCEAQVCPCNEYVNLV
ncbi:MAG: radical SAM protein [Candidatus Omnitrophota bacterium]|nr:radical SAM protein [Candidatus Omnitrophota bacterium]